jgi:hypothetical protein
MGAALISERGGMTKRAGARANALQLRTLLIAPRSDLANADAEMQRIVNALHPECVLGTVTTSDVLDAVQADAYNVIWFLGHSGADGLQLADGTLSAAHLAQMLRQAPPSLVVLNSCSSFHTAIQLHDDLQCAIVCTVLDVPDLDAYITGALLAGALAQGLDTAQAYQVSRPAANRQYILLNGSVRLNGTDEIDDTRRLILRTAAELQRGVQDMHSEIGGVIRTTSEMQRALDAMRRDVAAVREEQTRVRGELAAGPSRYQAALTRPRMYAWLVGFVLFLAGMGIWDSRDAMHTPPAVAGAFAATVFALAAWAFIYGIGFRVDRR